MATGDTLGGSVRVMKEETIGHRILVAGNFDTSEVDGDSTYFTHINPNPKKLLPRGDSKVIAPDGVFNPGEVLEVQHLCDTGSLVLDYDITGQHYIKVIEEDLNTGRKRQRTLTIADQEETADGTSSTTIWQTYFKFTCPDRRRIFLAGMFKCPPIIGA